MALKPDQRRSVERIRRQLSYQLDECKKLMFEDNLKFDEKMIDASLAMEKAIDKLEELRNEA